MTAKPLFAINPNPRGFLRMLGGRLPVLIVDEVFQDPTEIRSTALSLPFKPAGFHYPGRVAVPPSEDGSLGVFLAKVLSLVNNEYLPRIPPIAFKQQPVFAFGKIETDFAITDVHPDELREVQRRPHKDPVPVFGLVYLNPEDRGGTLFFDDPIPGVAEPPRSGYCSTDDPQFGFVGKIEGQFNRLAIYPGFVRHTGEISGGWIRSGDRFANPRLTQRLIFTP
jgi:hypothetical protein